MMRAILDLGTNSVRLLVAEVGEGRIEPLIQESRVTRLGQGVDVAGHLQLEAMERTLNTLKELVSLIPQGVPASVLATSAVRDSKNRNEFASRVKEAIGIPLQILSGTEEAKLSFAGAVLSLKHLPLSEPITVVDIGGGSTEIYTGLADGQLLGGDSAQVGAVRMLERHITSHPLLETEQLALEQDLDTILQPLLAENLAYAPQTLIAVGGTATTLAAMVQNLAKFSHEKVTGFEMSLAQLQELYRTLGTLSLSERKQISPLQPGREDIIICGAAILVTVTKRMGFSKLLTSVGDLLYGSIVLAVDEGK